MPRFANMAIRDDEVSVKQESMDIDLSEENFPSLSERNLKYNDNYNEDIEVTTYHDEMHQDHMGGRLYILLVYKFQNQLVKKLMKS